MASQKSTNMKEELFNFYYFSLQNIVKELFDITKH